MTDDDTLRDDLGADSVILGGGDVAVIHHEDGGVTIASEHEDVLVPDAVLGDLRDVLELFEGLGGDTGRMGAGSETAIFGAGDDEPVDHVPDGPILGGQEVGISRRDEDDDTDECPECGEALTDGLGGPECAACGWEG